MPSVYTSTTPNVAQHMNKNDVESHIQATTYQTITQSINTTFPSYTPTATPPSKGLGTTAIVFIVLAVVAFFIALGVIIYCFYRRRRDESSTTPNTDIVLATPAVARRRPEAQPPARPAPPDLHSSPRKPRPALPLLSCMKPLCREYLNGLNLNTAYFNSRYDQCFCSTCHDPSNSDGKCGNWCKGKHGWVRFGLSINKAHQRQWSIFKEWNTSYYGTSANRLALIFSSRFLPFDGDELNNGTIFHSGHPDTTHCTTSPSLVCASQRKFTTRSHFRARDRTNYDVQLVLQCKQKPDSYTTRGDAQSVRDIEWITETRCCSIPFGLFMRLQEQKT